ncbi:hypothetical protein BDN72DRAFT_779878, partial [Pluteus cervinus]
CPSRAFLAEFMQDECHLNCAWAKLCGLPPREISRWEHALREALEWRCWVCKILASMTSPVPHPIHPSFLHRAKFAYDRHHHYLLLPFHVLVPLVQISSAISLVFWPA